MTTQESTPSFARDIQPLFRMRDRISMRRAFDLWDYHDVSTHAQAILGVSQAVRCRATGSGPMSRSLNFVGGSKSGCLRSAP